MTQFGPSYQLYELLSPAQHAAMQLVRAFLEDQVASEAQVKPTDDPSPRSAVGP